MVQSISKQNIMLGSTSEELEHELKQSISKIPKEAHYILVNKYVNLWRQKLDLLESYELTIEIESFFNKYCMEKGRVIADLVVEFIVCREMELNENFISMIFKKRNVKGLEMLKKIAITKITSNDQQDLKHVMFLILKHKFISGNSSKWVKNTTDIDTEVIGTFFNWVIDYLKQMDEKGQEKELSRDKENFQDYLKCRVKMLHIIIRDKEYSKLSLIIRKLLIDRIINLMQSASKSEDLIEDFKSLLNSLLNHDIVDEELKMIKHCLTKLVTCMNNEDGMKLFTKGCVETTLIHPKGNHDILLNLLQEEKLIYDIYFKNFQPDHFLNSRLPKELINLIQIISNEQVYIMILWMDSWIKSEDPKTKSMVINLLHNYNYLHYNLQVYFKKNFNNIQLTSNEIHQLQLRLLSQKELDLSFLIYTYKNDSDFLAYFNQVLWELHLYYVYPIKVQFKNEQIFENIFININRLQQVDIKLFNGILGDIIIFKTVLSILTHYIFNVEDIQNSNQSNYPNEKLVPILLNFLKLVLSLNTLSHAHFVILNQPLSLNLILFKNFKINSKSKLTLDEELVQFFKTFSERSELLKYFVG